MIHVKDVENLRDSLQAYIEYINTHNMFNCDNIYTSGLCYYVSSIHTKEVIAYFNRMMGYIRVPTTEYIYTPFEYCENMEEMDKAVSVRTSLARTLIDAINKELIDN